MSTKKKTFLQYVKEYLGMALASLLNSIALYTFVNPAKLVAGGLSGLSSVLSYVATYVTDVLPFGTWMSIMFLLLNIPVLVLSLIYLRGDFTFKSIFSVAFSTITLAVLPEWFPTFQFSQSTTICVIMGGVVLGLAMHVATLFGASNGGTEIIGKIVAVKKPELDLSKVILIVNFAITVIGCVVVMIIEKESVWLIIHSLIFVIIAGEFMGMLQRGFDHPQKYLIVTTNADGLSQAILHAFKRGLTTLDVIAKDGETQRKMILVVVQYRQSHRLKALIAKHDPEAFTFVKDVHDVFSRPTFNRSYKQK